VAVRPSPRQAVQDVADEVERAWLAEQGEGEVSIT
jgi:hypothetical protein